MPFSINSIHQRSNRHQKNNIPLLQLLRLLIHSLSIITTNSQTQTNITQTIVSTTNLMSNDDPNVSIIPIKSLALTQRDQLISPNYIIKQKDVTTSNSTYQLNTESKLCLGFSIPSTTDQILCCLNYQSITNKHTAYLSIFSNNEPLLKKSLQSMSWQELCVLMNRQLLKKGPWIIQMSLTGPLTTKLPQLFQRVATPQPLKSPSQAPSMYVSSSPTIAPSLIPTQEYKNMKPTPSTTPVPTHVSNSPTPPHAITTQPPTVINKPSNNDKLTIINKNHTTPETDLILSILQLIIGLIIFKLSFQNQSRQLTTPTH